MKYNQFVLDINLLHSESSFEQFVISRSLSTKPDQISKFLSRNGQKSALQHVAFSCRREDIFELNGFLENGLKLALPPDGYYGKLVSL